MFTFAGGSRKLYDIIHRNQDIHVYPVDYTNLPHNIMQNDKVVSINNTTQIDLQGQAASESAGHRHISGTGGQLQFVRGAYASHGGKSFICMSSTYDKKGEPQSRIVSMLTPGNIVTTPRVDTMYVATEYGHREPQGQVGVRARQGPDLDRAPQVPRAAGARRAGEEHHLQGVCCILSDRASSAVNFVMVETWSRPSTSYRCRASGRQTRGGRAKHDHDDE